MAVFPVIFLRIITTTLIRRTVPRPLIIYPKRFNSKEIDTIKVSKELKASCKYIKLEAKTLNPISEKNIIKNTLSIYDNIRSLTTDEPSDVNSAFVSQKSVKNVYTVIIERDKVSKGVDSRIFKTKDFIYGITFSYFGIPFLLPKKSLSSLISRYMNLLTTTMYTNERVKILFN